MEKINVIIKTIRKELGLSQNDFAELVGSNRCNIAKYETDAAMPPGDVLLAILVAGSRLR